MKRKNYREWEVGDRHERWTVVEKIKSGTKDDESDRFIKVECECGTTRTVSIASLCPKKNSHCGCVNDKPNKQGLKYTSEYNSWRMMRQRCQNPNYTGYGQYGAIGIKVCERWATDFEPFYKDMGCKPHVDDQIDRIDVYGDYTPENCRWASRSEQQFNTRRAIRADQDLQSLKVYPHWYNQFTSPFPSEEMKYEVKYFDPEKDGISEMPSGRLYIISPAIAKAILAKKAPNREIAASKVKEYSDSMKMGEWEIGQAIYFDDRGNLIDGQQRMSAVARQTQDFYFTVFTGIPRKSCATFDQGKSRTARDIAKVLDIPGITNLHTQIASCMHLSRRKAVKISNVRRNEICLMYREGIDFVVSLKSPKSSFKSARFLAAIAKAYYYEAPNRLREFMKVGDSVYCQQAQDVAAAALAREYLKAANTRGNEINWFLKCERAVKNFCDFSRDDSVAISDINFYPLPGIDLSDLENLTRWKESKVEDLITPVSSERHVLEFS